MQFPAALQVQLVQAGGEPLPRENVLVYIEFYLDGAPRYVFVAGLTDPQGRLQVLSSALEEQLAFNRTTAGEAFQTTLGECDSVISLSVPPGAYIDDVVEVLRQSPAAPETDAALQMYQSAANLLLNPTRMAYNLAEVPQTGRARLTLEVEPAQPATI